MRLIDLRQLPENLTNYICRQLDVSKRAAANAKLAERIAENIKETKSLDDGELRIHNIQSCTIRTGSGATNPGDKTKSFDPVYCKLSLILQKSYQSYGNPYIISGYTQECIDRMMLDLERRTMTEKEYEHLNNTSINKLLQEWFQNINKEHVSV